MDKEGEQTAYLVIGPAILALLYMYFVLNRFHSGTELTECRKVQQSCSLFRYMVCSCSCVRVRQLNVKVNVNKLKDMNMNMSTNRTRNMFRHVFIYMYMNMDTNIFIYGH